MDSENASGQERIDACLAACEGIDTELLEPGMLLSFIDAYTDIQDYRSDSLQDTLGDLTRRERLAKYLVLHCFRNNSPLENIHAGRHPMKMVDRDGNDLPWERASHITDDEMKELIISVVDNLFFYLSLLSFPESASDISRKLDLHDPCPNWDDPKIPEWCHRIAELRRKHSPAHEGA